METAARKLGGRTLLILAALWACLLPVPAQALDVELVAAVGSRGEKAGQFDGPTHVAVDAEGNIHVSDSGNGRIEVLGPDGNFLREYGKTNTQTPLGEPWGIAFGPDHNSYVADRAKGQIFVFAPNGSLVATYSSKGSKPGQLKKPKGIAVDSQGRIYVADVGNRRVSVFSGQGIFLYAIDPSWDKKAEFREPIDVAVDPADNLFVIDSDASFAMMFNRYGGFVRQVTGVAAGFREPVALAADRSGSLAVLDASNQSIRHLGPQMEQFSPFGTQGRQPGQFDEASGIAFDDAGGRFLVADTENDRVQIFKIRKREVETSMAPLPPSLQIRYAGQIKSPATDVALNEDGSVLYVALPDQHKVQVIDPKGNPRNEISAPKGAPGHLREPTSVLFAGGTLYVSDHGTQEIHGFDAKGVFQFKFGESGSDPGEFDDPRGMSFYGGNLYVADTGNDRLQELSARGVFRRSLEGAAGNEFDDPWDLAVAADGSLYVADTKNHQLRKLTSNGGPAFARGGEGYGRSRFEKPRGVVLDGDGYVYVLDLNGVQIFDMDGNFVTRFGAGELKGPGNFVEPTCLSIDARTGIYLYVCDPEQETIQIFNIQRIPDVPQEVVLASQADKSTLSWQAPAQRFRESFVLYVADSPEGPWRPVAQPPASPFELAYPLTEPGTYFRLSARSYDGLESSASVVVEDRYRRGVVAYEQGRYDDALAAFDAQLLAEPGHAPSMLYKGRTYGKLEKFDEATNVLTDLARVETWKSRAILALAEVFYAAGKIESADDNVRRVIEGDADNTDALRLHARIAIKKGLYEDAIERANKAIRIDGERLESLAEAQGPETDRVKQGLLASRLILGDAYMAKRLPADAIKTYLEARKQEPKNVAIYTKLAAAFLAHGDKEQAVKALSYAAKLNPGNAALLVQVGQVYFDAGDLASARGVLRDAEKVSPDLPAIYILFGRISFEEQDYEGAAQSFLKAADRNPNDLQTQLLLGLTYKQMGKESDAKAAFDKVIALTPPAVGAQLELGKTFLDHKLYDLALDRFDAVTKLDAQNPLAPRYAGEAYYELKQYEPAINKLEESVRRNPNDAYGHYLLGRVYLANDIKDKALAQLKLAAFIAPRKARYQAMLAQAYLSKKNYARAAQALDIAHQLEPKNPRYEKAYKEARSRAAAAPRSGTGPLELTEVTFKKVRQSEFRELAQKGFATVFLKNNSRKTIYKVKVTLLAEGLIKYPAEEYLASIKPGQTRSVELKGKFNQVALDLRSDVSTLAEIKIEYFFSQRRISRKQFEPFLIEADLNRTSGLDQMVP